MTVGGGIANYAGAELKESVVTANTALNGKDGIYGGGIFNSLGAVALSHTKVFGNTPDDCAGCSTNRLPTETIRPATRVRRRR